MFQEPLDPNMAYSFHHYSLFTHETGEKHLRKLVELAVAQNVPLWNGEFGAHTDTWLRQEIELFENPGYHVSGWIFYPWKRVAEKTSRRYRHLMEIRAGEAWDRIRTSVATPWGLGKKYPKEVALGAMNDFIEAIQAENLAADPVMVKLIRNHAKKYGTITQKKVESRIA